MCNRGVLPAARCLDLHGTRSYDQCGEFSLAGAVMKHLNLLVATLILTTPLAGTAQTLAQVAQAEQARRAAITKPAKVYTNDDLRPDITTTPPTAPVSTNGTPAAPAPSTQVPSVTLPGRKAEPAPPERDQAYWSARINAARAAVERSKIFAEALQSRINALTTDSIARDDPAQRAQLTLERQRALAELERVKKEVADQTKAISDIEEEARKAGVPPGWLR